MHHGARGARRSPLPARARARAPWDGNAGSALPRLAPRGGSVRDPPCGPPLPEGGISARRARTLREIPPMWRWYESTVVGGGARAADDQTDRHRLLGGAARKRAPRRRAHTGGGGGGAEAAGTSSRPRPPARARPPGARAVWRAPPGLAGPRVRRLPLARG